MGVRTFGSVWRKKKPGGGYHPGFYISFGLFWKDEARPRRFKKYGGKSKAAARGTLAKIETLVDEGVDAPQILHDVFGDAIEGRRTFVQLRRTLQGPPRPADTDRHVRRRTWDRRSAPRRGQRNSSPRSSAAAVQKWLDSASPSIARDRESRPGQGVGGLHGGIPRGTPRGTRERHDQLRRGGPQKVFWLTQEGAAPHRGRDPTTADVHRRALATALGAGRSWLSWGT
jgi:hypothetical protein